MGREGQVQHQSALVRGLRRFRGGERPSKGGLAASSFSGLSANLGEASRTLYEGVDQQATAVPAGSLGSGDLDRKRWPWGRRTALAVARHVYIDPNFERIWLLLTSRWPMNASFLSKQKPA